MKKNESIRLNVFLQEHGIASRRKSDELIEAGQVRVNGEVVKTLGTKIQKGDEVLVNGKKLSRKPTKVTYLFHKPYLAMTSRADDRNRATIYDLPMLKKLPGNVQPIGRLDFKSEGLLLLTNDGDLALALSHPKYSVQKTYSVLISSPISQTELEQLRKGIQLEDGFAKPLSVKTIGREKLANSQGQWIEIVVTEGRNRLVRRLLESLGLKVVRLVRVAIGDLRLPGTLTAGKLRLVTEQEKKYLSDLKKSLVSEGSSKKINRKEAPSEKQLKEKKELKAKKASSKEHYKKETIERLKKVQSLSKKRKENMKGKEK